MPPRSVSANRKRQTIAFLAIAGFLANYLHLPLYFGVDFLWGSIFVLLAVWLYGMRCGALVALLAYSFARLLWGHWWVLPIFVAEAVFVGAILHRRSFNIVLLDALFWLIVGMPMVWLIYRFVLDASVQLTLVVMLKDAVNGIFNALLASLFITYAQGQPFWNALSGRLERHQNNSLSHTLFNLLVSCVLVPTLLFTMVDARQTRRQIERDIANEITTTATALATNVQSWQQVHLHALQILAASPEAHLLKSTPELEHSLIRTTSALGDCRGISVINAQGKAVASYPSSGAGGVFDIGANRAAMADFRSVAFSRRALVSNVFAPPDAAAPMTMIYVPILMQGRFAGAVLCSFDVAGFRKILVTSLAGGGEKRLQASLVDRRHHVIASTGRLVRTASLYPYRSPSATGDATYQWMPPQGTATMRWQKSFMLRSIALAELPWKLYVRAPFAPQQNYLNRVYTFNLTLILVLTLGALLLAGIISRRLARPLQQLAAVSTDLPAKLLQPNPPPSQWPRSTIVEIDSLVRNFRGMEQTLRDRISDIQQAQWALAEESARLAEANRLKDDFLAVLSHELRTPLVPILGYADLIATASLNAAQQTEAAHAIERNARVQLRLVEDLLDVTSILSGKMHLNLGVADLPQVVRAAIETVQFAARAKEIEITAQLDETLPRVSGDAVRLQQVVWNMLSNAVKFTPPGGKVRVHLEGCEVRSETGETSEMACIRVTDNGMGISKEFLPHVFDRFRQADSPLTRPAGGLGLGMFIVRQIMLLHGGDITAESEGEDCGATFTATLPLRRLEI